MSTLKKEKAELFNGRTAKHRKLKLKEPRVVPTKESMIEITYYLYGEVVKGEIMKEITGRLNNWWFDDLNNVYWGFIENDSRKRFRDGTRIHTSRVLKVEDDLVYTLNSIYELGEKGIESIIA